MFLSLLRLNLFGLSPTFYFFRQSRQNHIVHVHVFGFDTVRKPSPGVGVVLVPAPRSEQAVLEVLGDRNPSGSFVAPEHSPPTHVPIEGPIDAPLKIPRTFVHAETEVVVRVGSINVIVTKKRKPYHREKDFTQLGLDPRKADILVVKIGYLVPELYDLRGDWIMALTPGGVDQDLERLDYKRIQRPMFPLDKNLEKVDLKTRFIKASHEL